MKNSLFLRLMDFSNKYNMVEFTGTFAQLFFLVEIGVDAREVFDEDR